MNEGSYVKYSIDKDGIIEAELDIKEKRDIFDFYCLIVKDVFDEYEPSDYEALSSFMITYIKNELERRKNQ